MRGNEHIEVIHISEIDEYLASRMVEEGENQLSYKVGKSGNDGMILLSGIEFQEKARLESLDFELSASEYHSLNDIELEELLSRPLVTSSALELFDFLLLRLEGFKCNISFTGNAWRIKVSEPSYS